MTSLVHLYLTKTFVTNSLVLITIYIRFCFDWVYLRIKRERKFKKKKNILLFKLQIYFYTTKNVGEKKEKKSSWLYWCYTASGGYDGDGGTLKLVDSTTFLYELNDYSLYIVMCWSWSHAIIAQMWWDN